MLILPLNSFLKKGIRFFVLCSVLIISDVDARSQFVRQDFLLATMGWERVNPALTASNKRSNVVGEFQKQWAGFKGSPYEFFATFNSKLPFSSDQAAGISFSTQSEGLWKMNRFAFQYAFRFPIRRVQLGLGLDVGFGDWSFDFDNADPVGGDKGNDEFHQEKDNLLSIASSDDNDIIFDLGFGVSFKYEKWKAGVSVQHLNMPKAEPVEGYSFPMEPLLFAFAEYELKNHERTFSYRPSIMIKTDMTTMQVGMMNLCTYKEKFMFGLNAWFWSSLSFMVGFELFDRVQIGYSYGLPLNAMVRSGGSHDVMFKYSFDMQFSRKNNYKEGIIL